MTSEMRSYTQKTRAFSWLPLALFLIIHSRESQLPCWKDTQAAHGDVQVAKNWGPSANSQVWKSAWRHSTDTGTYQLCDTLLCVQTGHFQPHIHPIPETCQDMDWSDQGLWGGLEIPEEQLTLKAEAAPGQERDHLMNFRVTPTSHPSHTSALLKALTAPWSSPFFFSFGII